MATNKLATIDPTSRLVTLINVYDVVPENQAELVQLLANATEKVMQRQPGFVSVSIHRSIDGTRVVNYAQWASRKDFERMMNNPEAQGCIKQFSALAKSVAPAVYEVSSVHTS